MATATDVQQDFGGSGDSAQLPARDRGCPAGKNEKTEKKTSNWVKVLNGQLRAAGAPGLSSFAHMIQNTGTTHIVTLLKESEVANRPVSSWCAELGVVWIHVPLSGGRLEADEDRIQLRRLIEMRDVLSAGGRVMVHCSAGMHRTGVAMYTILRHCGMQPEQALQAVHDSRVVTYEELIKERKKMSHQSLVDLAEALFSQQPGPECESEHPVLVDSCRSADDSKVAAGCSRATQVLAAEANEIPAEPATAIAKIAAMRISNGVRIRLCRRSDRQDLRVVVVPRDLSSLIKVAANKWKKTKLSHLFVDDGCEQRELFESDLPGLSNDTLVMVQ